LENQHLNFLGGVTLLPPNRLNLKDYFPLEKKFNIELYHLIYQNLSYLPNFGELTNHLGAYAPINFPPIHPTQV